MLGFYKLRVENERLKKELLVSNGRIVESAKKIKSLEADYLLYYTRACSLQQSLEDAQAKLVKQDGLPFVDEVIEALKDEKAFSSRFMPNVKFSVYHQFGRKYLGEYPQDICYFILYFGLNPLFFESGLYVVSSCGEYITQTREDAWHTLCFPEVSKFEAIPELVPDGMVYDKESDSLITIS